MKPVKRRSLRFKWMALISAAVFISLLGSTVMLFVTVRSSLQETFAKSNAVQVESATREIRMMTDQFEKSVEQLAKMIAFTMRNAANPDQAVGQLLQEAQAQDPSLLGVFFIPASSGKLQASPPSGQAGDARATPIYELALQKKETSWTNVRHDEAAGRMLISVVTPVLVDGEWQGAAGFDIDLQGIGALRASGERFGNNKLIIYDSQGLIVSSFMRGMDGRNLNPDASGAAGAQDVIEDPEKMKQAFAWVKEIAEGKRSGIDFRWENVSYSGDVSFVYSLDWSVVSFVDKNAYYSSLIEFFIFSAAAMVIGLLVGGLAAYYIAAGLLKIINKLRAVIARTAEGDLTAEFEYGRNDEIGDLAGSYNAMLGSMRALIQRVHLSVNAVEETAGVVKQIAHDNVVSGMEVARSTEEIAAGASHAAEEVEKSTEAVARLSKEIETLIRQSDAIERDLLASGVQIQTGSRQAEQLASSYSELESAFRQVTALVADLHEKSQSISSVTQAISEITEQTNVLSMNATIEAARAGEHGRGFAVVAGEVRNLADQAKRSAQSIQSIISVVLSQTQRLVSVVGHTNQVNQTQKLAVNQVGQAMKTLIGSLENMQRSVRQEIQTITGIESLKETVVASIRQISSVSEQTTASTQEIASSVEAQTGSIREVSEFANRLAESVAELKDAVSKFKLGDRDRR